MGFDPVSLALIASTVVGIGTAVYQGSEASKAASAQKRATQIQTNKERNNQIDSTRKQVRERRLKAAILAQQSNSSGTKGSSGELGATSSLSASLNSGISTAEGNNKANESITEQGQIAADHLENARKAGSYNKIFQSAAGAYGKTNGFKSIFS